jgi:hypothetical protein
VVIERLINSYSTKTGGWQSETLGNDINVAQFLEAAMELCAVGHLANPEPPPGRHAAGQGSSPTAHLLAALCDGYGPCGPSRQANPAARNLENAVHAATLHVVAVWSSLGFDAINRADRAERAGSYANENDAEGALERIRAGTAQPPSGCDGARHVALADPASHAAVARPLGDRSSPEQEAGDVGAGVSWPRADQTHNTKPADKDTVAPHENVPWAQRPEGSDSLALGQDCQRVAQAPDEAGSADRADDTGARDKDSSINDDNKDGDNNNNRVHNAHRPQAQDEELGEDEGEQEWRKWHYESERDPYVARIDRTGRVVAQLKRVTPRTHGWHPLSDDDGDEKGVEGGADAATAAALPVATAAGNLQVLLQGGVTPSGEMGLSNGAPLPARPLVGHGAVAQPLPGGKVAVCGGIVANPPNTPGKEASAKQAHEPHRPMLPRHPATSLVCVIGDYTNDGCVASTETDTTVGDSTPLSAPPQPMGADKRPRGQLPSANSSDDNLPPSSSPPAPKRWWPSW